MERVKIYIRIVYYVAMATSKRIEIIKNLFTEAEEYLAKGDAVQSSEKLYKATEECIKLLSERFNLPEVK
ncbi:MAG: PaREP1 family protein, partial [Thermoproteota archaeon]|nr:PaREP1 family protein [Thermoproteota archaeon]